MKELEDYKWFPPVFRDFQTDFIGFVVSKFNSYSSFINHLRALRQPKRTMTDLCSGSGEPAISIFRRSESFTYLLLSDKFPRPFHSNDTKICNQIKQMDVLEMEFQAETCYTMFNAFHHFSDVEKVKIVQAIKQSGSPAYLVEILQPSVFCLIKIVITTTLGTVLLTPFIRPYSFNRLFFTYILPINIFTITFDGIVSVFKSRSIKQYKKMFANSEYEPQIVALSDGLNSLIIIQIDQAT